MRILAGLELNEELVDDVELVEKPDEEELLSAKAGSTDVAAMVAVMAAAKIFPYFIGINGEREIKRYSLPSVSR